MTWLRGSIFAALFLWVAVLIVVVSAGGGAPAPARSANTAPADGGTPAASGATNLEGLPYRSVSIQVQRIDWIPEYKKIMDKTAAIGADTVLLVVDTRQENGKSARIYLDYRMTPTVEQLGDLIDYAKKRELRVILMPIVLLDKPIGDEWRGQIHPDFWEDWWDSYRDMIQVFSSVAEVHHADVLVVGSELISTEHFRDQWIKTIDLARSNFKGKITYSSNWDHYDAVTFWDQLDLVGMNSYWQLSKKDGNANVTKDEIKARWKEIQAGLFPFLKKVKKPLLFTEIGWFSMPTTAKEPWNYTDLQQPVDLELQKKLYEAFFESWWGNPMLGGFSIWEMPPGSGGPDDKGYTPEGKPAGDVLKQWLAKGRWEVK